MSATNGKRLLDNVYSLITIGITLLGILIGIATYATRIDERNVQNTEMIYELQEKAKVYEEDSARQSKKLDEIIINLKNLMESQNIKYQKAD